MVLVGQAGNGDAQVDRVVGRHHAGPAAVGDDGQAVAAGAVGRGKRLGGGKQLADRHHAHHAGAAHRGIEHVVGADQRAGVRHRRLRAGGMAPHLDHEHRLEAGGGAQGAHEAARVADAFDVDQDALGLRVGGQVVENFAEIHVGRSAHRNHAGKTDVVGWRPVENGGAERARLRYQGELAGLDVALEESGVEADAGAHDAQAVGADHAHAVSSGVGQHGALDLGAMGAYFAEAGGQHYRGAHAVLAAGFDDVGHGCRIGADHRQFNRLADFLDRGIGALALALSCGWG